MRIQFCHNATEDFIAEFEVTEVPTKEECEAIENEIYEAMEIAKEKYRYGYFVVESDGCPNAKLMMADDGKNCTEWSEF